MRFILLLILISCSSNNDPYVPKLKDWSHFQSAVFEFKDSEKLNYKFTFRFNTKEEGHFFIEVMAFNDKRLSMEKKFIAYRESLYGDFKLSSGELSLKYLDPVVGSKDCAWAKSLVGKVEKIPFLYSAKKNQFTSKLKEFTLNFRERGEYSLEEKYKVIEEAMSSESCSFFEKNFPKGFFNFLSQSSRKT